MSIDTDELRTLDERSFGARVEASEYTGLTLEGLRFGDGAIADVINFDRSIFPHFDLPATLDTVETA